MTLGDYANGPNGDFHVTVVDGDKSHSFPLSLLLLPQLHAPRRVLETDQRIFAVESAVRTEREKKSSVSPLVALTKHAREHRVEIQLLRVILNLTLPAASYIRRVRACACRRVDVHVVRVCVRL